MDIRTTIFMGVDWDILKSIYNNDSGQKSINTNPFIIKNLFYYSDLQGLVDALQSGKDIAPRLTIVNIEELVRGFYKFPEALEGHGQVSDQQGNISNSPVAKRAGGTESNSLIPELIPYDEVTATPVYFRNNLVAKIHDKVFCAYDSSVKNMITSLLSDELESGSIVPDNSPCMLAYVDAEEVFPVIAPLLGASSPVDGHDDPIANDSESSIDIDNIEEQLSQYLHRLVQITLIFNGSSYELWLTDEPIENFKAYQYTEILQ